MRGLQLGDPHQPGGVVSLNHIAGVDQAQADASGDGRGDPRIVELQVGVVHLAAAGLHLPLVLLHQGFLGIQQLAGDGVPAPELAVALQVEPGMHQQRLVPGQLAAGLGQHHLERPRVDFRQQLAGLDLLPLGKMQAQQLAIDARAHQHAVDRHHAAKGVEGQGQRAGVGLCRGDRHSRFRRLPGRRGHGLGGAARPPPEPGGDGRR
ncbi:hypothetical protein D3C72_1489330 [compost metagenome]